MPSTSYLAWLDPASSGMLSPMQLLVAWLIRHYATYTRSTSKFEVLQQLCQGMRDAEYPGCTVNAIRSKIDSLRREARQEKIGDHRHSRAIHYYQQSLMTHFESEDVGTRGFHDTSDTETSDAERLEPVIEGGPRSAPFTTDEDDGSNDGTSTQFPNVFEIRRRFELLCARHCLEQQGVAMELTDSFVGTKRRKKEQCKMERPVATPVKRVALELAPEDLQAEFTSYSIATGDANSRLAALQDRYDEEYDAAMTEYDTAMHKLEMQRTKQAYENALSSAIALEREALEREPNSATIVRQVETNVAPKRLVVRGISQLACCALLRAMRNNTNVNSLDLSNNSLTDAVGVAIGNMLTMNKKLQVLDLGFNHLTNVSLQPIGEALRTNTVLTSLILNSNAVFQLPKESSGGNGNSGNTSSKVPSHLAALEPFTSALVVNTSLTTLDLFNTGISQEVGRALAHALSKNTSLISVEVASNVLNQSDLANIASYLQKNQARFFQAEAKSAQLLEEMKEQAHRVQVGKTKEAKRVDDAEWHDENARKRAEIREAEDWESAKRSAEAEVQHLLNMEAENKKYLERLEAEKKPKAKGKK